MKVLFTKPAQKDFSYWEQNHPAKAERIRILLKAIIEKPFDGIGKPEPLKFNLQGLWSRRIDKQHRLVYRVMDDHIRVISCRYHYES